MTAGTGKLSVALLRERRGRFHRARAGRRCAAHLNMDIAYLSEFVDGRSVFRAVNAPGREETIKVGDSVSLDDVYCQHILEGRLPELIVDTADEPLALGLPITAAAPIGSHVSIPIRREDGSAYGMFCCLSAKPNRSLNQRDLQIVRGYADLASREVNRRLVGDVAPRVSFTHRWRRRFAPGGYWIAYQPIFALGAPAPGGFEALLPLHRDAVSHALTSGSPKPPRRSGRSSWRHT